MVVVSLVFVGRLQTGTSSTPANFCPRSTTALGLVCANSPRYCHQPPQKRLSSLTPPMFAAIIVSLGNV